MDFGQFSEFRKTWRTGNKGGLDAGNSCVYEWAGRWPQESVQEVDRARHRCHLAEAWLEHLGLANMDKTNVLMGQGVRYSLGIMMEQDRADRTLLRPDDVYPQYARIQHGSGMEGEVYSARLGLPWERMERKRKWSLLVCDPLKPWGGRLDDEQWSRLIELAARQNGCVWIDGAYARIPPGVVVEAMEQGCPVVWMGSLSKFWLRPKILGGVLGHRSVLERWKDAFRSQEKDIGKLSLGWELLRNHPNRPDEVEQISAKARARLLGRLDERGLGMGVKDPGHGYMLRHEFSASTLIQEGVLALPESVFLDNPEDWEGKGSILSAVEMGME